MQSYTIHSPLHCDAVARESQPNESGPKIRISVLRSNDQSEVREFQQPCVTLGRHTANDIVISESTISKRHGEIRVTLDGPIFCDLHSANGSVLRRRGAVVQVNNEPQCSVPLEPGDELILGGTESSAVISIIAIGAAATDQISSSDVAETLDIAESLRATEPKTMLALSEDLDRDALLAVHRFTQQSAGVDNVGALLDLFSISILAALQETDQLTVYLLDHDSGDYQPAVSRGRQGSVEAEPLPHTLKDFVIDRGQAVQFSVSDPEFDGSKSLINAEIVAGLCAPLYSRDQMIGVALADSRVKPPSRMTVDGLELFTVLSHQLALCIDNARLTEGLKDAIEELQRARAEMERLAFFDPLTGLHNRRPFFDRLEQAIQVSQRRQHSLAVLYLDIDNFKSINDTFGHDTGDKLLCTFANRLRSCVRDQDTVARLGGDEFAILLCEVSDPDGAQIVAEKILDAVRKCVTVGERSLSISTSVGISLAPEHGVDAEALLVAADRALYRAKSLGRNNYQVFADEMAQR